MIVAVAKERFPGEARVSLVPASVPVLSEAGAEVLVESGAGLLAGFTDQDYIANGAKIAFSRAEIFSADVVLQVRTAGEDPDSLDADRAMIRPGQTIIGMADPLGNPQAAQKMAETGVALFALEMVPRITRAQSMDVLSSMATVAGYRAVLLAAEALPKMFPMLMTAAGTVKAAKVFVVGAGVAGLQAIATAKRLGAIVSAYDVRPAVKEQVLSLGAKFVEIGLETGSSEEAGGYAKQMDQEFYAKQRNMMKRVVAESDVVITTAAVPGKRAPTLLTVEMVDVMPPGSVILDLAAERGGNCELTEPGKTVERNGVKILGPTNLAVGVAFHASQMYSKNIATFLLHMLDDGQLVVDTNDEIICDTLISRDGKIVNARVSEALGLESPPSGSDDQGIKPLDDVEGEN